MSKFDSIKIGDKAELSHIITEKDIEKFVELTGDDNKIHIDSEYASKTSLKQPVAHGMLGASFISTIIGTKLPGDGALWFSQNLEFLLPVRVGDTITVKAEVIKKIERENVIELQTDIFNQHRQKVTFGVSKVKIIEQQTGKDSSERQLKKKVAVVIGSTGGIGRVICNQLAIDGFDVAVHYFSSEKSAIEIKETILKIGRNVFLYKADIRDEKQVQSMVENIVRNFETITVLVNCATLKIPNIKFSSLIWEDIQEHLDINVKGAFYLTKAVVPVMEKENYGKIINIVTQAIEVPNPEWLHYITAKSALSGFSKALAVELAPKGIRVNIVSPGMTETGLIADIPEKVKLLTAARTPLRRIARPEDIANVVSFLASEKADFITGETIRVNGGQVML
jgi:3-oxoacyl-[acyl-carrier protein] reductase